MRLIDRVPRNKVVYRQDKDQRYYWLAYGGNGRVVCKSDQTFYSQRDAEWNTKVAGYVLRPGIWQRITARLRG